MKSQDFKNFYETPAARCVSITAALGSAFPIAATCVAMLIAAAGNVQAGMIVVDYSPDAVIASGGSLGANFYGNTFDNQILADKFTWQGGSLTGASIFSKSTLGAVGDSVRIVVLKNLGFGEIPVIDITTTIDVVDSQFSNSTSSRKHATITPTFLEAGDYFFYMTGAVRFTNIGQGTGFYDDGIAYTDMDGDPGINDDADGVGVGDLLFQLEGDISAVPEPSSLALLGMGGLALLGNGWRRSRSGRQFYA